MIHVTRRTKRTPPKFTIMEHKKDLIVTHRQSLSKVFLDQKFVCPKKFCWTFLSYPIFFVEPKIFYRKFWFRSKLFFRQNFFLSKKNFRPKILLGQNFLTQSWQVQIFYFTWSLTLRTKCCYFLFPNNLQVLDYNKHYFLAEKEQLLKFQGRKGEKSVRFDTLR